jgi:hypothetical protein
MWRAGTLPDKAFKSVTPRDDDGMYLFDPQEVEALRARRPAPREPIE